MEKQKTIKEVFSDYETKANISDAKIEAINLIKSANILEINLESDEFIDIYILGDTFQKFELT